MATLPLILKGLYGYVWAEMHIYHHRVYLYKYCIVHVEVEGLFLLCKTSSCKCVYCVISDMLGRTSVCHLLEIKYKIFYCLFVHTIIHI